MDITKAKFFLKAHGSKLQHLETFSLMLATAESNYKNVRLRAKGNKEGIDFSSKELECAVDLAVLQYLRKYARLPDNAAEILLPTTSDEKKLEMAMGWYNA